MTDAEIANLQQEEKLEEALLKSLKYLPADARNAVEAMLNPANLGIVIGTLLTWAGSHFFGVGEIVDVILLTAGIIGLGFAVFEGAGELWRFITVAMRARSEAELERAGEHFARAVFLLGVSVVQTLLLHGQGRSIIGRGRPKIQPRLKISALPPPGAQLKVSRPSSIPGGSLAKTNPYGVITIARNQSITDQRLALYHELVHRFFSPRTGPLLKLRAELAWSSYSRSAFLRYVEEALAEGYAQLRVNGLAEALEAFRFPISHGYVTVSQLLAEGLAVGTIVLGGAVFRVSVSLGSIPESE